MTKPSQEQSFLPAIGASMDFYESVKGSYPTAKQIQELFAVIDVDIPLERIEADRALLLTLERQGLHYDGRTTHD